MNNFVAIRPFKTFRKVRYYTFHIEGREQSESAAFFSTYETDESLADDLDMLVTWIQEIGKRGARAHYFRKEDAAEALPPPARIMAELTVGYCTLRLYCVRLSEQVVILANGGRKESQTVRDSPDVYPKFRFANKMAQQLLKQSIHLDGNEISNLEDIELWD